jgi:hypothetical protein
MTSLPEQLTDATAVVAAIGCTPMAVGVVSDAELLQVLSQFALLRRAVEVQTAIAAAEVAQRSRPELGHSGLAGRQGFVNVAGLIQSTQQSTRGEATKLIEVGTLITAVEAARQPDARDPAPWDAPLADAVASGRLSLDAANQIRRGLGKPCDRVPAEMLTRACETILAEMGVLDAGQLGRRARDARIDVDSAGVKLREHELHARRTLSIWDGDDGLTHLTAQFGPEDGALLRATAEGLLGPRNGGPRFVADEDIARGARLEADPRTNPQIIADGFLELLRAGLETDPRKVLGSKRPTVRVMVTGQTLTRAVKNGRAASTVFGGSAGRGTSTHTGTGAGRGTSTNVGTCDGNTGTGNAGTGTGTGTGDGSTKPSAGRSAGADREASGNAGTDSGCAGDMGAPYGLIEGSGAAVSLETIERLICDTGLVGELFAPDGALLDVGRDQRLFTAKQRTGLQTEWGGCADPTCDRPPSMCEAHHIIRWRDGGRTDVADGVLLCRRHHMLLHDHGGQIVREGTDYFMTRGEKTPGQAAQVRFRLESKNALYRKLVGADRGRPSYRG